MKWRPLTNAIEILEDKYAWRYVEQLQYRVEAFKAYLRSGNHSETVAFWLEDYASREDATRAAKMWLMRGELEDTPEGIFSYELAPGKYREPDPTVMRAAW